MESDLCSFCSMHDLQDGVTGPTHRSLLSQTDTGQFLAELNELLQFHGV